MQIIIQYDFQFLMDTDVILSCMQTDSTRVVNFPEIYYFQKFPEILAKAWKL